MEKSIEDLHAAISRGDLTYEELTAFYLDRIKTYDAGEKGINAVAAINPKAIEEARTLDASSATPADMRGIPVLVKRQRQHEHHAHQRRHLRAQGLHAKRRR